METKEYQTMETLVVWLLLTFFVPPAGTDGGYVAFTFPSEESTIFWKLSFCEEAAKRTNASLVQHPSKNHQIRDFCVEAKINSQSIDKFAAQ